jgi:LuxR family maltose regulon positive regulatory protein
LWIISVIWVTLPFGYSKSTTGQVGRCYRTSQLKWARCIIHISMSLSLLSTKLYVPPSRVDVVSRPYLIEKLLFGAGRPGSFTLVSGPAGFGKTTLLSEFVARLKRSVAWLSLEEGENDPIRFWTYLITACQSILEDVGEAALELFSTPQLLPDETVPTILINDLNASNQSIVLVLDDYHEIQNSSIHAGLLFLIDHLPHNLHIMVSTRSDPPWPLARYRARNQLTEIRAQDMRFTSFEATSFLNQTMGLNLSSEDVAALEERTEGWIAGLQLAALSMKGRSDVSGFIKAFTGSHTYVAEYLVEEILQHRPEEVQTFLLQTSILERLNAGLCEAVTGCENGQSLLTALHRANLFLVPLDDEQQWYRYHHLFADLLAFRLKQALTASAIRQLHCRASAWLAQNDLLDEAIQHALLGKDYERAIALVERVARTMMFTGRVNDLRNWLEALPVEYFETHIFLKIYRTWIDLLQGKMDLSEPALLKMETMLRSLPPSPDNDTLLKEMIVILSHWVALAGNTSRAIRLSQEALAFLPEEDLASRARVFSALAISYGSEGDVQKADTAFSECIRLAIASGNYTLAAHTLMRGGIWLGYYGKLHEAARVYQSIIDLGAQTEQKIFFPAGQGLIGLASIYLERNELESAEKALQQGMELCTKAGLDEVFTGWILKSRLRQAKGDLAGALEELQALERAFPRSDTFFLTIRQIQVNLAMGNIDRASRLVLPFMDWLSTEAKHITTRPPVVVVEIVELIIIRVYLAQGEIQKALDLLVKLQATAEPGGRIGHLIEIYLLRALAYQIQSQGETPVMAFESLEQALALAEPEGYSLLFTEVGLEIIPLLHGVMKDPATPDQVKKYARRLLKIVSREGISAGSPIDGSKPSDEMIEPLTERELEVMRLIADGLKYKEIAGRLYISLNTVRTYVKGIYGKLNVNNRSQAIAQAHHYNLI